MTAAATHPLEPAPVRSKRGQRVWLVGMTTLTVLLVALLAPSLDYYPRVTSDEVWTMSASYKLAREGVLGSDMFAGFFEADRAYFISLPVQHIGQAIVFRLFGAGIAQARSVSLAAGLVLLWVFSRLALRWYGWETALLAAGLLALWRCNLLSGLGLPFAQVARSARYDMAAVMFAWVAVYKLDSAVRQPGRLTALAAGLSGALAGLAQFFGFFVLPLLGLLAAVEWRRRAWPAALFAWLALGAVLPLVLYGICVAVYADAFKGQTSLKEGRDDFGIPGFYADNARREPNRYGDLTQAVIATLQGRQRAFSAGILLFGVWPALGILARRLRCTRCRSDLWLVLGLVFFMLQLALLDQTKAPLYGIILVPSLSLVFARAGVEVWRWGLRLAQPPIIRLIVAGGLPVLLGVMALETALAFGRDMALASQSSRYAQVGHQLRTYLTTEATVLGAERWWWALHDHSYFSITSQIHQWPDGETTDFAQLPAAAGDIDFVIVSEEMRGDRSPAIAWARFRRWLAACSVNVADWTDPTYGRLEVLQVSKRALCRP